MNGADFVQNVGFSIFMTMGVAGIFISAMLLLRQNWARMLLVAGYLVGLLFIVPGMHGLRDGQLSSYTALVQTILQGVAISLLFFPAADRWFRGR